MYIYNVYYNKINAAEKNGSITSWTNYTHDRPSLIDRILAFNEYQGDQKEIKAWLNTFFGSDAHVTPVEALRELSNRGIVGVCLTLNKENAKY